MLNGLLILLKVKNCIICRFLLLKHEIRSQTFVTLVYTLTKGLTRTIKDAEKDQQF